MSCCCVSRYDNSSGKPGSYDEAVFKIMATLTTIRLPLFQDFIEIKKFERHYDELNKLNISDMLLKVMFIYKKTWYNIII